MTPPLYQFFVAIGLRTAIVVVWLVLGLRILGKRQLGQINIYDLALIMLVANSVQNAMTAGDGHLGTGFASAGTLLLMGAGLAYVFVRSPKLEQRIIGVPTVLVHNGHLNAEAMRRENFGVNELMAALRQHELCHLSEVKLAVLELDGTISVVPVEKPDGDDDAGAANTAPHAGE